MTSRWGEGVWGTFVWGDLTNPRWSFTWLIDVDWDGNGAYDGTNEALVGHLQSVNIIRGRQFFLKSDGSGFQPVSTGTVQLVFLNNDGRYNPYNVSSPIYPYLQQNQKMRIRLEDDVTGVIYNVFAGYIDDIRPNMGKYLSTATLYASDGLERLGVKEITSSQVYQTIRFNAAISQALFDAGWSGQTRVSTTVTDSMPYWWESGRTATGEIQDLANAASGIFFVANDGAATYLSSVGTDSSVVTLTEADIQLDYGVQVPTPREIIRNKVTVYSRARTAQSLAALWKISGTPPQIASGATLTIWASLAYNGAACAATSLTVPVATTDYTANTKADGTGTDKTAKLTIIFTPFATAARLDITNTDAGSVYLTLAQVRGIAITPDDYTYALSQNDTSIAKYTEQDLTIQTDWLQDINTATSKAQTLTNKLSIPRQFPRVMVKRAALDKSLSADLFSIVTVNFPTPGISDELRVGYMTHTWTIQESNVIDTLIYLEPNLLGSASGNWIFPATAGVTTIFT